MKYYYDNNEYEYLYCANVLNAAYKRNDGAVGFKDVKVFERKDGTIWIVDNDIFIRRFTSELFHSGRGNERDLQDYNNNRV